MRFIAMMIALISTCSFASVLQIPSGSYVIQLYFGNTPPFTDELALTVANGVITGRMHVPDDFVADIEAARLEMVSGGEELSFHLPLPEKYHEAYPNGLDYHLSFRPFSPPGAPTYMDYEHLSGFVTTFPMGAYSPVYVASVVGFRKP